MTGLCQTDGEGWRGISVWCAGFVEMLADAVCSGTNGEHGFDWRFDSLPPGPCEDSISAGAHPRALVVTTGHEKLAEETAGAAPAPCCAQSQGVRAATHAAMQHRWWLDINGEWGTVYVVVSFCPWCGTKYAPAIDQGGG